MFRRQGLLQGVHQLGVHQCERNHILLVLHRNVSGSPFQVLPIGR